MPDENFKDRQRAGENATLVGSKERVIVTRRSMTRRREQD
jgi:hypothetical protein